MRHITIVLTLLVLVGAAAAWADSKQGAGQMMLNGGTRGAVPFGHARHQEVLGDCQLCHALFPQQAGAIDRLKAEGQLVPKQVMNKMCIKCHKAEQAAGKQAGPVTCTQCHVNK